MTAFEVFLLALVILVVPAFFWLKGAEKYTLTNVLAILGVSLFFCLIPAIFLAWGLRCLMPEAQYVGNGFDNYGERYIPFYDTNSQQFLSISDDYIINASDSSIYVMKINYTDDPYGIRPKSELVTVVPPKTTTTYSNYISKIFPKSFSNTGYKQTRGTRRRAAKFYKVQFEIMILSESQYHSEVERNFNQYY